MKGKKVVWIWIWLCMFLTPLYGQTDDWPQKVLENPERIFWISPEMCSASMNGSYLAVGGSWTGEANFTKVFDLNGGMVRFLPAQQNSIWALVLSPDNHSVFTASGSIIIQWDLTTGAQIRSLPGHQAEVFGLDYGPGDLLASSGGFENTIRIWDLRWGTSKVLGTARTTPYDFNPPWVGPVEFVDSYSVVSGYDDGVRIWNVNSGSYISLSHLSRVNTLAVSKDKTKIAAGSRDGIIMIWDRTSGTLLKTIEMPGGEIGALDFSTDGAWILAARQYNIAQIFDTRTGEYLIELRHGGTSPVFFAKLLGDGKVVSATGYPEGAVRIWQVGYPPRMKNMILQWSKMKGGR